MTDVAIFERLSEYRAAARMAVEADRPLRIRLLALLDLLDAARAEEDATLREWAEGALWREAGPLLGAEGDEPSMPSDPVEMAARQLRARGYAACPSCARPLHGELDFVRWKAIRQAERERLEARDRTTESDV